MVHSISIVMMPMIMIMLEAEEEAVVMVEVTTMMTASHLMLYVCDGAICFSDVLDMSLIACG